MPGSADFAPHPFPLADVASLFLVVLYDDTAEGDDRFIYLPNIECLNYHYNEGAAVPSAEFRYLLNDSDPSWPFPSGAEQLWPDPPATPYAVANGDRILVYEFTSDGERILVFDGFVDLPQLTGDPSAQQATFHASGVAVRLWDDVIMGRIERDGFDPDAGAALAIDRPAHFNPRGRPNCTPAGKDYDPGGDAPTYPVFLSETLEGQPAPQAFWTLGGFARYLCGRHNAAEQWVNNLVSPTGLAGADLDAYLQAARPVNGQFYDLSDPSTYQLEPIVIRDYDAARKPWPVALAAQLSYYGFYIFFNLRERDDGTPVNEIIVYRKDGRDANAPVDLNYPPAGTNLDDGKPDFNGFELVRDAHDSANTFVIETEEVEYEASFVLSPGFPIDAADATSESFKQYDQSALANAAADARRKYRFFRVDEAGLGHWDFDKSEYVTGEPADLDPILGAIDNDIRKYVARQRKPEYDLFSTDPDGRPRRAALFVSRDYAAKPGVWDHTGTWRACAQAGWKLDTRELGIWLTCDNPETWRVPRSDDPGAPGDVVRVITSLSNPGDDPNNSRVWFLLVVRFAGDHDLGVRADKRDACRYPFPVTRLIDAKDHYKKHIICKSSYFAADPTADAAARDDTAQAQALADSLRAANEFPRVAGALTVPWVVHSIGVGDFLGRVNGRDIDLAANPSDASGESAHFPVVVGVSVRCVRPQSTQLKVMDRRSDEKQE